MSEAILQASGIVKRYGKFTALAEVDLRILPRTVHSVIGPNGAGKTTLFHVLTGTLPITAGKIVFDGHDVTHEPDHKRASRGVARSFQVTSLFANLSVRENLRLAAQGVDARRALNAWTPPRGTLEHADVVDSVLERLALQRFAGTAAGAL
jgi:branched-chain amino acid transport system ATP-binding protein